LKLEDDAAWNGGADGTDILKKFVVASTKHLDDNGKLIVGVQDFYVNQPMIEKIASMGNFRVSKVISGFLNPSKIYVMRKG
jgi:hypothetical protein